MSRLEEIKKTVQRMYKEEVNYNPEDEIAMTWYDDVFFLIEEAERLQAVESWHRDECALCRERKRAEELESKLHEMGKECGQLEGVYQEQVESLEKLEEENRNLIEENGHLQQLVEELSKSLKTLEEEPE